MGMVDPENLRVPIWVGVVADLGRPEHNIWVSVSVDRIAIATDIVCCIVHRESFR